MESIGIKIEVTTSPFITAEEAAIISYSRQSVAVLDMMKNADCRIRAAAKNGEVSTEIRRPSSYGDASWQTVREWLAELGYAVSKVSTYQCTVTWG